MGVFPVPQAKMFYKFYGYQANTMKPKLTPRETEVIVLLAEFRTSKEFAATLYISVKTVSNHRENMLRKFVVKSTLELVEKWRNGGI